MQDIFDEGRKVMLYGHDGIVFGQLVPLNSTLLHRSENHRYLRKKPFSMALDEVRSRGTEGDNKVGWPIIVEVVEIFYE